MKRRILSACLALSCAAVYAQAPLASGKKYNQHNPLSPLFYCADPTAVEYDGRVYVYGTNDHQEFLAYTPQYSTSNSYGKINQLVCMSSADLVNWTWHAPIDVKKTASWTGCSWAPSICSKTDAEGKTHFYLYFANGASGIGVITSDSPTGPWKDPLGKALVAPGDDVNKYGLGGIVWLFDPGVVVDDNGDGWLSYGGGGEPNSVGNDLIDGNTRLVKLTDDMIHFDGNPIVLPAPFHFEASELNYIGGKYVYTYCANWGPKRELWSQFEYYDHSKTKPEAPYAAQMCYMTTTTPLVAESWQYQGSYLDHPGGNNHTHLQKFGNSYYLFHHSEMLSRAINNGDGKGYRSISANKITVDEANCKINKLSRDNIDNGITQIKANRPVITDLQQAEMIWNASGVDIKFGSGRNQNQAWVVPKEAGAWTAARQTYANNEVLSFKARLRGKGKMEIRVVSMSDDKGNISNAPLLGTVEFDSSSWAEYAIQLNSSFKGLKNIYFVFTEVSGTNVGFDEWQFFEDDATNIPATSKSSEIVKEEYFTISGTRCSKPANGVYIKKTTYADGSVASEKRIDE